MKPACTRPASASALPWPKRWSASAGISAWRTAKKVTSEPTRSSDESTSDDSMLTESVIQPRRRLGDDQDRPRPPSRRWWPAASGAVARSPSSASGIEGARRPGLARRGAAVLQPVVQAERAVLPELDQQRLQAEARPVRRPRHLADDVPGREFGDALLQREAALERPRLVRRPGADLAAARRGSRSRRRPPRPWSAPPALRGAPAGAATSSGTAAPPWDGPADARPCGFQCWCRRRSPRRRSPSAAPCAATACRRARRWPALMALGSLGSLFSASSYQSPKSASGSDFSRIMTTI